MATIRDVLRFVVVDSRNLFPYEDESGAVIMPGGPITDNQTHLWRSTRSLMEQLRKETQTTTEEQLADHFDHVLSKRAQLIFDMVQDQARKLVQ